MSSPLRVGLMRTLGALALPLLVVRGASWLTAGAAGPAASVAALRPVEREAASVNPVITPLTAAQRRAIEWSEAPPSGPELNNPFARLAADRAAAPRPQPGPDASGFVVSAILKSERGAMASINRRLYLVGDQIDEHWRVIGVDPVRIVVTIQHSSGSTVELSAR